MSNGCRAEAYTPYRFPSVAPRSQLEAVTHGPVMSGMLYAMEVQKRATIT